MPWKVNQYYYLIKYFFNITFSKTDLIVLPCFFLSKNLRNYQQSHHLFRMISLCNAETVAYKQYSMAQAILAQKKKRRVCIPDRLHAVRSVERKQGLLSLIPISNYGGPNVQKFPPYLSHPERGNGHTRHFRRAREQHGIGIPWSQTCRSGQNGARASDRKQKALPPKLVNAKGREAHAGDWAVVGETNEIVSQTVQCWIWKRNMFFLSWKSTIFCDPVGLQTTPFL